MTPLRVKLFLFVTQSSTINNSTILNAQFMDERSLILAISTITVNVRILASILQYNLVKYWPIHLLAPFIASPCCVYIVHSTAVPIG